MLTAYTISDRTNGTGDLARGAGDLVGRWITGSAWSLASEQASAASAIESSFFSFEHGQRLKNSSDAQLDAAATHAHYLSIYQNHTSELQQLQQQQQL